VLAAVFFMAQYLQIGLHYSPLNAGLRLLPWGAAVFFAAPVAGAWINRVGERLFVVIGLLLVAAGAAWLALMVTPHLAYWLFIVPLVLTGLGASMAIPATQSAVMSHVGPQHIGKASGTFTTLRQLGGAVGIAIAVATFAGAGGYGSAQAFTDGFGPALAVSAGLASAGALTGLLAPGAKRRPDRSTARANGPPANRGRERDEPMTHTLAREAHR
jgi:MFS family permease